MSNGDVTKWVNVEYLEKLARLCRGTDSRQLEGSINHVNEANIILMFSNAPFQELEQMLIEYYRVDSDWKRDPVRERIEDLASRLVEAVEYMASGERASTN